MIRGLRRLTAVAALAGLERDDFTVEMLDEVYYLSKNRTDRGIVLYVHVQCVEIFRRVNMGGMKTRRGGAVASGA